MNEKIEKTPTLAEINTINKVAYDATAAEYAAREEQDFSLKNDPEFTTAFLNRVREGFPDMPEDNMAILDVGVGPGVNLSLFAEAGFQTYGIDISDKMIDVARKKSPDTIYTERDFLAWQRPREFHGIMMKAFVHLFPEHIARQIIEKGRHDLEKGGVLFLATTIHDTPSEGIEQKGEFKAEARRYRKRWTRDSFVEFLKTIPGLEIIDETSNIDASGKTWMNIMLRKISE